MTTFSSPAGQPLDRVEGHLKVTGGAHYAGDFKPSATLLYGAVVNSGIARGRIRHIDTRAALQVPGVIDVLTHDNRPSIAEGTDAYRDQDSPEGVPLRPLYDNRIYYSGQPIALVVAENRELARYAGTLVAIEYERETHCTDLMTRRETAESIPEPPPSQGDADSALDAAPHRVEAEYLTPVEHHSPMEPHASTVHYHTDGHYTVHDKTQGVKNSQSYLERVFDLNGRVRVVSPFIGGAFGSGLRPQYQLTLAMMAAIKLKQSVQVTLTRQQMFTFGYRPRTWQQVALGADKEGRLLALSHHAIAQTSQEEDYIEHVVEWGAKLYHCDNRKLRHELVSLDVPTPLDMRAPGATLGVFALECAMDELACQTGIDPLQLRLINYSERDQNIDRPYSSKALRECYARGAEHFGWSLRPPKPRSQPQGSWLLGQGMATGVWEALQVPASAKARLEADGRLVVSSATMDIGTGTYTAMTQIAAETLGLPVEWVEFQLGDTNLPDAPLQGGSFTVSSVGSAVQVACQALGGQLLEAARQLPESPFASISIDNVEFREGNLQQKGKPDTAIPLKDIVAVSGALEAERKVKPDKKRKDYATATHSAIFAEVKVDETLGIVRVERIVSAVAAGRIINPKTATSQLLGGVVWGIGMALEEETLIDHNVGRYMNHNLAEYHFPVNADIGSIEAFFVEEEDTIVNALGSKGVGEIGIVGVAAAIANAVYHATGQRIRELPITPDKLVRAG